MYVIVASVLRNSIPSVTCPELAEGSHATHDAVPPVRLSLQYRFLYSLFLNHSNFLQNPVQ
ncbi:MAG: hypothetical protein AB1444_08360 [Spirochaetota bacterium]